MGGQTQKDATKVRPAKRWRRLALAYYVRVPPPMKDPAGEWPIMDGCGDALGMARGLGIGCGLGELATRPTPGDADGFTPLKEKKKDKRVRGVTLEDEAR